MRDLFVVLFNLCSLVPEEQPVRQDLNAILSRMQKQARFTPPESMGDYWNTVSKLLFKFLPPPLSEEWQFQVISLFVDKPIDVVKLIYGIQAFTNVVEKVADKTTTFQTVMNFYTIYHNDMMVEKQIDRDNNNEGKLILTKASEININKPAGPKKQILKDYLASLPDNTVKLMQALLYAGLTDGKIKLEYLVDISKDFDPDESREYLVSKLRGPEHIKRAIKLLNKNIDLDKVIL